MRRWIVVRKLQRSRLHSLQNLNFRENGKIEDENFTCYRKNVIKKRQMYPQNGNRGTICGFKVGVRLFPIRNSLTVLSDYYRQTIIRAKLYKLFVFSVTSFLVV